MFLLGHGAATLLSVTGDEIARDEVRRNYLVISETFIRETPIFRN